MSDWNFGIGMNKLTQFENMIFEGCKANPMRLNVNSRYKIGGNKEGWQRLNWYLPFF